MCEENYKYKKLQAEGISIEESYYLAIGSTEKLK